MEGPTIICACRTIWRQRVLLKVWIFGWLLLRRRRMGRVFRKKMYSEILANCILLSGGEEDCTDLFFQCPFACMIWATQGVPSVDATYETTFRDSIQQCRLSPKEGGRVLAVLWAIWLYRDVLLSRGRLFVLTVVHDVGGIMTSWFPNTLEGS